MQLSDKEQSILAVAELAAALSVSEIAERTGFREHVVRYALRGMRSRGLISAPQPFVNMYRLNYHEYQLHLSIGGGGHKARKNLLQKLITSPSVAWLYETGGDFQYAAVVNVENVRHLFELIDHIQQPAEDLIIGISIALRRSYTLFSHYLSSSHKRKKRVLSYGVTSTAVDQSKLNLDLLSLLCQGQHSTLHQIAQALKTPDSTIIRHKKLLEDTKVIEGYLYRINNRDLGFTPCRLVISVRGNSPELRQEIFSFARKSRWVVSMVESIGNCDYVLGVDTNDPFMLSEVREDLLRHFGARIFSMGSFTVYRILKQHQYLFNNTL